MSIEIILASPPEYCKNALLWGAPVAHMAYKTCGAHLYRAALPESLRRGLMVISNTTASEKSDIENLCGQIISECHVRCYSGVIADFEPPCPFGERLLSTLSAELSRRRLSLYTSEWASHYTTNSRVILSTAVSGGSLAHRLSEAAGIFGRGRLVPDLEISHQDFLLPIADGEGQNLSHKQINELLEQSGAKSFFSNDLYCNYFTYKNRQGLHFVLYDDATSVAKKIDLIKKLGIREGILLFPEIDTSIAKAALC